MTRRHDPAWVWMIGAFGGGLALAVAVLAGYGTGPDGLRFGIFVTARWSFLFFWLSYAGGAMAVLFGAAFAGLARQARALGLAFVTALQVHIGLVFWLGVVTGQIPLQGRVLWFFLVALFFAYLLALLSFGIGMRKLGRVWRPLLLLGTTYILIAFGRDFVPAALDQKKTQDWLYAAEYVPFALLSLIAIPLRLAAFLRRRFGLRSATARMASGQHRQDGVTAHGVLGAVLDHANRAPDHPAVKDLDRALTRGELRDAAGRVAAGLLQKGVEPGDRVALLIGNSVDFVVAALGCLWAGVTFVPLAITDPDLRRAQIVADCRPAQVITAGADQTAPSGLPVGTEWTSLSELNLSALSVAAGRTPPPVTGPISYIIYTSGTTGIPKGVQISPEAFFTAVEACADAVGLTADDRALAVSPVHFDGSFSAIFPALVRGVPLVIPDREALLFPRRFFSIVASEGITATSFSPSYLRLLRAGGGLARLADTPLRVLALGGEAPSTADIRAVWAACPGLRLVNRYGPTETTIAVAHLELTPELLDAGLVPIGQPHPGSSFHVVDEHGRLVDPPGAVGELYIGGPQLMAGYLNDPAMSAAVLRTDVVEGTTLYRTGDLVFREDRGNYVYVGRSDRVIKRHGVRMSLVEVTEALAGIDGVASAACTTFDLEGDLGVVAFVVPDRKLTPLAVRQTASERLPQTMLPDQFVLVANLPLTSSSKVDERRLLKAAGLSAPNEGR